MSNNKIDRLPASEQIAVISDELERAVKTLHEVGFGVSVFGSARIPPGHKYYSLAQEVGKRLAEAGLMLIAGGGPGLMEASNKGAYEAGGRSVGLNIRLPREASNNQYQTHSLQFEYFYSRKATFFMHSLAYIALPGGFGTLDELFEILTLVQTRKVPRAPIVLMGTEFWGGLLEWIKDQQITNQLISPDDINLITLTDDVQEVMHIVNECCSHFAVEPSTEPVLPQ